MANIQEGATATNKKTGQKIVFRNGSWQPMETTAPEMPQQPSQPEPSLASQFGRQAGLIGRDIVTGLTAIPGMAADAAMTGVNLATGKNYQMPTAATQDLMTRMGVPEPETPIERGLSFVRGAMIGAKAPMPGVPKPTPAAPQVPTMRQQTLRAAQKEGYVIPPSMENASLGNVMLESVGGKAATQQVASARNQKITNALAAQALGLPKETQITPDLLGRIRQQAGTVYNDISRSGRIAADKDYLDDLSKITQSATKISKDFPKANVSAGREISELVDSLKQGAFDAESAMEYMKNLRQQSSANLSPLAAVDPSKRALGKAQRDAAAALEDMVIRHLKANGKSDLADKFDDARRLIAKSHTIESAMNLGSGNVIARQLAGQLKKGKPLSDELETVSKFAAAYPKAADEMLTAPGVSALDYTASVGTGLGAGALTGDPLAVGLGLLYPVGRYGARQLSLSPAMQRRILAQPKAFDPSRAFSGAAGAFATTQE